MIQMMRQKKFYEDKSFSSQTLVAFYKHQIKVKIWPERERLSFLEFGEKWVTFVLVCLVIGASLTFNLEVAGT